MADEETAAEELTCECVKWHSPKSPIVMIGDTPVCLVTAHRVQELVGKYQAKGKVVKADQKGASKYQRDLSEKVFATLAAPAAAAPAPAAEAEAAADADANTGDGGAQEEPVSASA